jgi:energy-coupling factor transport system permease protein
MSMQQDAPLCLVASLVGALTYLLLIEKFQSARFVLSLVLLVAGVGVFNALFNTRGETVLFTWWNSRPFTLEGLTQGFYAGALLAACFLWCVIFFKVVSLEKLQHVLGSFLPRLSLVLALIVRLVPAYQTHAGVIQKARQGAGIGVSSHAPLRANLTAASRSLSSLTFWALEEGMVTADSMLARGYGLAPRTSYQQFAFRASDAVLLGFVLVAGGIILATSCGFVPWPDSVEEEVLAAVSLLYCCLPTCMALGSRLLWRF